MLSFGFMATITSPHLHVNPQPPAALRRPAHSSSQGVTPEGKAATAVGSLLIVAGFVLGLMGYLPAFALEFVGLPLIVWGGATGMRSETSA